MATMIRNYSFKTGNYTLRFRGKKVFEARREDEVNSFLSGWNSERAKRGEGPQEVKKTWSGQATQKKELEC